MTYREERIVGLKELKSLFFELVPILKKVFLLSCFGCLLWNGGQEPLFFARATFTKTGKAQEHAIPFRDFLLGAGMGSQEQTSLPILESDVLLSSVVKKLGLQIQEKKKHTLFSFAKTNIDHFLCSFGKKPREEEQFALTDVVFEGERPREVHVVILEDQKIAFLNKQGEEIGRVSSGEEFCFEEAKLQPKGTPSSDFSVLKIRGKLLHVPKRTKERAILQIVPLPNALAGVRGQIKIKRSKLDPNILHLECKAKERHLAANLLNQVIESYEHFLKDDNAQKMQRQIDYLTMREKQLMEEWDHVLKDYEKYLKQNLNGRGYLNCAQEIEVLGNSQTTFTNKLFDIDLELKRLGFPGKELKRQNQGLLKQEASKLQIEQEKAVWNLEISCEKTDEPLLELPVDLNLDAARTLYRDCHQQKDALEFKQVQYQALLEKMGNSAFDVSSLTSVLTDLVAQQIVQKAAETAVQLKDSANRSLREQQQLLESLDVQKRFIISHLEHTLALGKVQIEVINKKITSLSRLISAMLEKEKNLITHKMDEITQEMEGVPERWRKENLLSFKKETGLSLLASIAELSESRNIDLNLYQGGVKCLDKAIPPMMPIPQHPLRNSFLFGLVMGFGVYFFQFAKRLHRGFALSHETLSLLGFQSFGTCSQKVSSLEAMNSEDMALLRKSAHFLSQTPISLIVGGTAPNFSKALCELIALQGKRILLIDYLSSCPQGKEGLAQFLNQEISEVVIHKEKGIDHIFSGGWSRYLPESVRRPQFVQFLEEIKTRYDHIIFYTEVSPEEFYQIAPLLALCDQALVAMTNYRKEDLRPFVQWEESKGGLRLGLLSF